MLRKASNYLPLIIALALGLRLVGITHGFPFIFHTDEPALVRSALGIKFDLNPGHFDWPHLYIYLNHFVYMVFAKFRDIIAVLGYKEYTYFTLPILWDDELIFYLITRVFSAVLGALTVIPVYLTAKKIFNQRAGWLAGLALAITPFHVWHSHYSLADVPMMFFLAWALYFTASVLFKNSLKDYILAGLFIGLAASTKYNGALMAGGLVLAHLIRVLSEKNEKILDIDSWKRLVLAAVFSTAGFVVGTPYSVLDYETFIRMDGPKGALWQFTNVGSVDFFTRIKQFVDILVFKLPENFGYTIMVLFIITFIYVLVNMIKNKKLWINKDLLFFALLGMGFIFYIAGQERLRAHYFFIVYPVVIVGSIGFLVQQLDKLTNKYKNMWWLLIFIVPLCFSLLASYAFYITDTRLELEEWLLDNHSGRYIYYEGSVLRPIIEENYSYSEKVSGKETNLNSGSFLILSDENTSNYKLVKTFDNKFRRGPVINIYTVN